MFYLKAPFVADLSVEVQIQLHHQQSVTGPGEARGAAAVRTSHITGPIEVTKVMVSWKEKHKSCCCCCCLINVSFGGRFPHILSGYKNKLCCILLGFYVIDCALGWFIT